MEGSEASCLVKWFAGWCRGLSPSKSAERLKQAPLRFNALCPPKLAASASPTPLQALCELDPSSSVVSVDGIGAFDLVSAMLQGLRRIAPHVVPFVRQFHGTPSTYWWENGEGVTHHVHQGEGGEQGDPLMPKLFCSRPASSVAGSPSSFPRRRTVVRFFGCCVRRDHTRTGRRSACDPV